MPSASSNIKRLRPLAVTPTLPDDSLAAAQNPPFTWSPPAKGSLRKATTSVGDRMTPASVRVQQEELQRRRFGAAVDANSRLGRAASVALSPLQQHPVVSSHENVLSQQSKKSHTPQPVEAAGDPKAGRLSALVSIVAPTPPHPDDGEDSDHETYDAVRRSMVQHHRYTGIPPVEDDLWHPSKALTSLLAFELGVEEKNAFEEFVRSGRPKTTPALVVNSFKHFMCCNSSLVEDIRRVPLSLIEDIVSKLKRSHSLSPVHFTKLILEPLLGKHMFLEQDALALFDFFDSDSDGEIDYRDVCCGFVLLRSRDGPVVPVVHRCILMVAPKARNEARLALMTRLELVHLTTTLESVLSEYLENARLQTILLRDAILKEVPPVSPKGIEMQQLRAQESDVRALTKLASDVHMEVERMMDQFSCDRRGNFPYAEVREFMLKSEAIRNAVGLLRVPRDDDLYHSFLSEYYRSAEVDEATTNREFKPSMRNRSTLLCGLQSSSKSGGMMARRQTFARVTDIDKGEETCVDEARESIEHGAPTYYTMRGMLYRRDAEQQAPAFVTKAEYFVEDVHGRRLKRF